MKEEGQEEGGREEGDKALLTSEGSRGRKRKRMGARKGGRKKKKAYLDAKESKHDVGEGGRDKKSGSKDFDAVEGGKTGTEEIMGRRPLKRQSVLSWWSTRV